MECKMIMIDLEYNSQQARAPNSPVVIVGTHHDVVREEFPPSFSEYLQQSIRDKFINVSDPEKCGFPRVSEAKNKIR